MQPLPYHAGLAAHLRRRLQSITALSACSCPLHLSMSGEPLTQKQSSQLLPAVPGIRQCATRRTLAPLRQSRTSLTAHVVARYEVAFSFRYEGSLPPVPIAEVRPTLRVGDRNVFAVASHNRPLSSCRHSEGFTRYRLGTGLQAMQLSPRRAALAGLRLYALSSPPALLPCYGPLSFRIR